MDTVRAVLAWYTEQIITERRSTEPDPARLERLLAEHRACAADQQALREAGPQERARIAADYAARYRELTGP
ncbi:hypothetical protein DVA86_31925 [Streptomyces armeniacus]|uniref:Uncharacterized protein n=1 Tax=Streptomyces armeniacus TaxID=83291 RepID=A0A345Y1P9_9ACTN|nr:hypothetical protein DVA86_31925 [Streptomyces armeniacus]